MKTTEVVKVLSNYDLNFCKSPGSENEGQQIAPEEFAEAMDTAIRIISKDFPEARRTARKYKQKYFREHVERVKLARMLKIKVPVEGEEENDTIHMRSV